MEIIGTAVVQQNGSIILPPELIRRLELNFGDEIAFSVRGEDVCISKLPDAMKGTVDYYMVKGYDRLAAEYFAAGGKKLTGVKANPDFTLTLTYEEREDRIYDCKPLLDKGGIFVHLRKYETFARVFIDYGAACWDMDPNVDSNEVWNNRIDLCPDTCYIDSVPVGVKDLIGGEPPEAKAAACIAVREEDTVAGFAVSCKVPEKEGREQ